MRLDEPAIRECCTDSVFERGQRYRAEDRIKRLNGFGDTITAAVQGSKRYELRLSLDGDDIDAQCTCPYDGPGECKHVVAVLLDVAKELPEDSLDRIDAILEETTTEELREFVRGELTREPGMCERFFATFGDTPTTPDSTAEQYRTEVDQLFEAHTEQYPVVTEAIDFSQITDIGDRYCEQDEYEQAAAVYRGLAEGIAANMNLVDAAYDHYSRTFQSALDDYVACLLEADLDDERYHKHLTYLDERVTEAVDYLATRYASARDDLESAR